MNKLNRAICMVGILVALAVVQTPVSARQGRPGAPLVRGAGTSGQIPIWMNSNTLGDSVISQNSDGGVYVDVSAATAVSGYTNNTSGSVGVWGEAYGSGGPYAFGVMGRATTSPNGIGVQGEGTQAGAVAKATGTAGNTQGLAAFSGLNPTGVGVSATGAGVGVLGSTASCTDSGGSGGCATPGTAGLFVTGSGGDILVGSVDVNGNWNSVFRVDSTGKGYFNGGTQIGGADFAEAVNVAKGHNHYAPGDLLVVDPTTDRQLTLATQPYSTLIAGIYSTKPGILATTHAMDGPSTREEVPVAVVGIVPCKVSTENGPIQRGDLLVTSSTPGHAMRGTDRSRMLGAVVGKALETQREGKGLIEVLVTLQ
jgi:hypothetical protein